MTWKQVAGRQNGAITLHQALEFGLTRAAIRSHLSSGRWQRLQHRVLLTHSGPVSDEAEAHGVLLAAGEDALLSHESTLWVWGIGQVPDQWTVLLPHDRRTRDVTGAEVVRTRAMPHGRSVNGYRTTSVQRAVVDIANRAGASVDDVIALVAKVCQKGLTNPERISKELASRRSHRMRDPMRLILGDVGEGIESLAEHKFLRGVLHAHGLPSFAQQVVSGRSRADFDNAEFAVCAEIDGLGFHAGGFRADRKRDRKSSARGVLTVRATWWDVVDEPCDLAQDLADTLRQRGWTGQPVPCSPTCTVGTRVRAG